MTQIEHWYRSRFAMMSEWVNMRAGIAQAWSWREWQNMRYGNSIRVFYANRPETRSARKAPVTVRPMNDADIAPLAAQPTAPAESMPESMTEHM